MTISHNLSANGYYINNEIWMDITEDVAVEYFKVYVQNLSNSKTSTTFISYVDLDNNSRVNLQSVIKSLFDTPDGTDNNTSPYKITITSDIGTSTNFTKTFIRGGVRSNDVNQNTSPNQRLRLSENLPVWLGFPVTETFLNPDYTLSTLELAGITDIDYRRTKGCNNIYFKFLNQKGGYSYWVFESYMEKENASNQGSVIKGGNEILDLGNVSASELRLFSKIPREYRDYAKDFIVSPDIYVYQNAGWKKVTTKNNTYEFDNVKKVYAVNFMLELKYRFNPSLLWSN
jgi:hypothetical protein